MGMISVNVSLGRDDRVVGQDGHTAYRADPVALAWVFGLRGLQQIEEALPGQLPRLLVQEWPD